MQIKIGHHICMLYVFRFWDVRCRVLASVNYYTSSPCWAKMDQERWRTANTYETRVSKYVCLLLDLRSILALYTVCICTVFNQSQNHTIDISTSVHFPRSVSVSIIFCDSLLFVSYSSWPIHNLILLLDLPCHVKSMLIMVIELNAYKLHIVWIWTNETIYECEDKFHVL